MLFKNDANICSNSLYIVHFNKRQVGRLNKITYTVGKRHKESCFVAGLYFLKQFDKGGVSTTVRVLGRSWVWPTIVRSLAIAMWNCHSSPTIHDDKCFLYPREVVQIPNTVRILPPKWKIQNFGWWYIVTPGGSLPGSGSWGASPLRLPGSQLPCSGF